jgi:hypothetical protein
MALASFILKCSMHQSSETILGGFGPARLAVCRRPRFAAAHADHPCRKHLCCFHMPYIFSAAFGALSHRFCCWLCVQKLSSKLLLFLTRQVQVCCRHTHPNHQRYKEARKD